MLLKNWQFFHILVSQLFSPKDSAPTITWDTSLHIDWYRKAEFVAEYNWMWPPEIILFLLCIVNFHPKLKKQQFVQLWSLRFDIQNQKQVQFCFKHNAPMYKELIWLVKYRNLWKMHFRGFGTKISKNGHSESYTKTSEFRFAL